MIYIFYQSDVAPRLFVLKLISLPIGRRSATFALNFIYTNRSSLRDYVYNVEYVFYQSDVAPRLCVKCRIYVLPIECRSATMYNIIYLLSIECRSATFRCQIIIFYQSIIALRLYPNFPSNSVFLHCI